MKIRMESDSVGTMEVPVDAYYGVQSLRAKNNFPITGNKMHPAIIKAHAQIKKAAAVTNEKGGLLSAEISKAIQTACDEVAEGKFQGEFLVDAIQGGAGTSANMNANEVIANRAIEILGGEKGDYSVVHPNDHVNMAQSTNDVYPSAGKIAILSLLPPTLYELKRLEAELLKKAEEFDDVIKMGRTQLQDAVPIRLGQSFAAYAKAVARGREHIENASKEMLCLNMGATAIGTGINASGYYLENIIENLSKETGYSLYMADDLIDGTQHIDSFVAMSGSLKRCAVALSKMANDLRLLSSGPKTGIGEINLPPMQNGSSIMPGKINPVIPEVVTQVAFQIIGNDLTITLAAEAGQMELNAFEPVLFYNIFESIEALAGAVKTFTDNCVSGITANVEHCRLLLEHSVGMVTALCPIIGYTKAAELAKQSLKSGVPIRALVLQENLMTDEELKEVLDPFKMTHLPTE
jgi:Aspartate ammonia-lyase